MISAKDLEVPGALAPRIPSRLGTYATYSMRVRKKTHIYRRAGMWWAYVHIGQGWVIRGPFRASWKAGA